MAARDRKVWDYVAKSRTRGKKKREPSEEYLNVLMQERDAVFSQMEEARQDVYQLLQTAKVGDGPFETARAKLVTYSQDVSWFDKEIARVKKAL